MKRKGRLFKMILGMSLLVCSLSASGLWGGLLKASSLTDDRTAKNSGEDQLVKIQSYEELVKLLKEKRIITKERNIFMDNGVWDVTAKTEESAAAPAPDSGMAGADYSETNVQIEGVDEADTLKNDNRYIYQKVSDRKIAVIDTKDQLKVVSTIEAASNHSSFNLMFLDKEKLIVTGRRYEMEQPVIQERQQSNERTTIYYPRFNKYFSTLQVYDVSNKKSPKLIREVEVEGDLKEIRKIGQTVYMLTNRYNHYIFEDQFTEEDILPLYKDSQAAQGPKTIMPDCIWYQPWQGASSYTLLTALQLDEKIPVKVQGILGETGTVYMNKNALYLTSWGYTHDTYGATFISKYSVNKQSIIYSASGHVKGTLLNQFSMDEYKGNLRIATTSHLGNSVYVLDDRLKVIGALENLAPGERIYSVRFTREKGYIVTFKQIDPLFVIDLSVPVSPKVLGELKIPGFSQYLHPIGEHWVVGIGRSTSDVITRDEKGSEVITGTVAAGIKLSLFDVKNPKAPREINHIILGTGGSYSGALDNHKMVTVHKGKNLLAIPVWLRYEPDRDLKNFSGAYVFGIEKGRLIGKAKLGKVNGGYENDQGSTDRVCYIGDRLYFLYDNKINEYELRTFSRIQTLELN